MSINRTEALNMAEAAINGERDEMYGSPDQNFGRIAKLWSVYLNVPIMPADVANMMILLKVARLRHTPGVLDSWLDIAGYAACGAEVSVS